ncbi:MAG: hypothetical protein RDV41_00420 [Planctomycetota bacterium]|nr:hypothetical protein [Planctomycetota bacterium]
MYWIVTIAILVAGFGGLVAQVMLLRELLVVFFGNELSVGVILANWLVAEAVGSGLFGRLIDRTRRKIETFVALQLLFSISLPAAVYVVRIVRGLLTETHGEGFGLVEIFYSSLAILAVPALTHGALFACGCKLLAVLAGRRAERERRSAPCVKAGDVAAASSLGSAVGRAYVVETAGTLVGGLVFTYVLVTSFHSFQIAFAVTVANMAVCACMCVAAHREGASARSSAAQPGAVSPGFRLAHGGLLAAALGVASLVGAVFAVFALRGSWADALHAESSARQFPGQKVVHYENSIYGNIVVAEREGQHTLYSNGIPVATVPLPDVEAVENIAHIPLLFHRNPQRVLVIGGGFGGVLAEILKHPVERVDYAELDPQVLRAFSLFRSKLSDAELKDPRVSRLYVDGRLAVARAREAYDVLIIGHVPSVDLQVNRLFTAEFFALARSALSSDGLLALRVPGTADYIEAERAKLNAVILRTLRQSFGAVRVLPGDASVMYISSKTGKAEDGSGKGRGESGGARMSLEDTDPAELMRRADERGVAMETINRISLEYGSFQRMRRERYAELVEQVDLAANLDQKPTAVFYGAAYWTAMYTPSLRSVFARLEGLTVAHGIATLAGVVLLCILARLVMRRRFGPLAVSCAIGSTGFAGMMFSLVLIFAFQAFFGYVFHEIGLLIAVFMLGTAAGGFAMSRHLDAGARTREAVGGVTGRRPGVSDRARFLLLEFAILAFAALMPVVFASIGHSHASDSALAWLKALFYLLCLVSGVLIGAQFPFACKLMLAHGRSGTGMGSADDPRVGSTAGWLYAADLAGGWAAGMIGGVFLLPLIGVAGACAVTALAKLVTALMVGMGRFESA